MKPGSADDPFADEPEDTTDEQADTEPMDTTTEPTTDDSTDTDDRDIPYVLERKRVKEGRDDVRQFFLREGASEGERQLKLDVEDELGKEVRKLDLREAAYLVAQRHPEEVAEELREWGYDYL